MVVNFMRIFKDKKKIYIALFTAAFIVIGLILYHAFFNFTSIIHRNIRNASATDGFLYLSDVTPFEWDEAFIIGPYIGGEALDEIVGVKCGLKPTDTDMLRRIVFIKDKKFVYDYLCSITDIGFTPSGIAIDKDHCKFAIEKSDSNRLLLKFAGQAVNPEHLKDSINELIDKSLKIQYGSEEIELAEVFTDEYIQSISKSTDFYKKDLAPYKIVAANLDRIDYALTDNFAINVRVNDKKGDYIQVMHFIKKSGQYFVGDIEYDI